MRLAGAYAGLLKQVIGGRTLIFASVVQGLRTFVANVWKKDVV